MTERTVHYLSYRTRIRLSAKDGFLIADIASSEMKKTHKIPFSSFEEGKNLHEATTAFLVAELKRGGA